MDRRPLPKFSYVTRAGKYARARDVLVHSASGRMPAWAAAYPRRFWKAADTYERKNGRLFRHYEIALPLELSEAQRVAVAGEYAEHLTAELNLPYSLAVHAGYGKNPHCHLVVSERMNDGLPRSLETWFTRHKAADPGAAGAKKTRRLNEKSWLRDARASWAEHANRALAAAGSDARIDHRTLAEQGIDREPVGHVRGDVIAMNERGEATDQVRLELVPTGLESKQPDDKETSDGKRERARDRDRAARCRARAAKHTAVEVECRDRRNKRRAASIRQAAERRAEGERARLAAVTSWSSGWNCGGAARRSRGAGTRWGSARCAVTLT